VQSLVEPTGRDLRVVVAGGNVVGAIERIALPGEWRTNVALGAVRRRVSAPPAARALAIRAVAARRCSNRLCPSRVPTRVATPARPRREDEWR
jgi:glutathione synthase/RimK-type ligase-like ATP-grasp enzyme